MDMPGKKIQPGVWVGPNNSISWDSTKVVGPTWIGHGSHLPYPEFRRCTVL